MKLKQALMM